MKTYVNMRRFSWCLCLSVIFASCTKSREEAKSEEQPLASDKVVATPLPPNVELNCSDGIDNEGDGLIDQLDNDCLPLPAPVPVAVGPVVAPIPLPVYPIPVFFGSGGGSRRVRREVEEPLCVNNTQDVNPRSELTCTGYLYGVTETGSNGSTVYTLVTIDQSTGVITPIGPIPLATSLPGINSVAGIDFDAQGNLILVATNALSVHRFTINCENAQVIFETPIYANQFLPVSADGLTIDPQGLAFTILDGDLNNDNNNDGRHLVKFGYEQVENTGFVQIDPALSTATFPLGLGAIGFPSPNVLHTMDSANDCEINKTNAGETCAAINTFTNFPGGFAFDYVAELDQDYASLITYAIVVAENSGINYLATADFNANSLTNISALNARVVGLAVNQSFEECDPSSDMTGTTCTNMCLIVESDCDDTIDNDMNSLTDCNDPACIELPICVATR